MPVGKLFQPADHIIVAGVAVPIAGHFPDLLQGVHDDQFGVAVFLDKLLQLLIQAPPIILALVAKWRELVPSTPNIRNIRRCKWLSSSSNAR